MVNILHHIQSANHFEVLPELFTIDFTHLKPTAKSTQLGESPFL